MGIEKNNYVICGTPYIFVVNMLMFILFSCDIFIFVLFWQHQIYIGLLIIIKCFDRHSVHLHARVVILKLQSGHCDQQSCNKRACNKQACNKRLYGTIASHDGVWHYYLPLLWSGLGELGCILLFTFAMEWSRRAGLYIIIYLCYGVV